MLLVLLGSLLFTFSLSKKSGRDLVVGFNSKELDQINADRPTLNAKY